MHPYRTHHCGELRASHSGQTVRLSGWIHSKRDHGGLLFIDLRDHFGITQCVIDVDNPLMKDLEGWRVESVVTVTGDVVDRIPETVNDRLPTGKIEVKIKEITLQSAARVLPFQVSVDDDAGEEVRLFLRRWFKGNHGRRPMLLPVVLEA